MKRIIRNVLSIVIIIALTLSLSACDFGSKRVTDIQQYGKLEHYIELPEFFPNSVEGYSVNAYAYNLESWMDVCHEIFLDITVTESQFDDLLSEDMSNSVECYYSDGFYEIVFQDSYTIFNDEHNEEQVVGYADIEKIVYNPETCRIVFVVFHANDTGVYPLKDVAYFNCFNIDENEYVKHLKDNN